MMDRYKHQTTKLDQFFLCKDSAWATRDISYGKIVGEVKTTYTFYYKTNKLENDGLFLKEFLGL